MKETFVMFVARLQRYLDGWLRLSKVDKTYESLLDFVLRDQLLEVCNKELFQYLRSKKVASSREMADEADLYATVRGGPRNVSNRSNRDRYQPYTPALQRPKVLLVVVLRVVVRVVISRHSSRL